MVTLPSQSSYFLEPYLRSIFESRITKSRAVGRDGMRLSSFEHALDTEISLISRKVLNATYQFTPYKERLISRGAARNPRQISIPTIRDRLTLRATCNVLAAIAPEAQPLPPHGYIKAIAEIVRGAREPLSFVRIDVRDFFPAINHDRLIRLLRDHGAESFLVALIEGAIKTPTGARRGDAELPSRGVPQGLSISNILSSIYMRDVDNAQQGCHYFRYVDDILVLCASYRASRTFKDIVQTLQEIGLDAHPLGRAGKSEICRVPDGIDYLGYHISPERISVRPSSYKRMFSNILRVVTDFKYRGRKEAFLFRLNLKITGCIVDGKRRGWLMFFAQTEDLSQLQNLDRFVLNQIRKLVAEAEYPRVKRFIKTYHEISYKGGLSEYVPNFDTYDIERKIALIAQITGASIAELRAQPLAVIDHEFESIFMREIADLEQDVIGAIS